MKVIADKNIHFVDQAFKQFGDVELIPTIEFKNDVIKNADVIIVRSEVKVNQKLLDGSNVKFVGTSTIGTDHIDLNYLLKQNIGFANAPGSNSNSVAEYVVAALLELQEKYDIDLNKKSIGVVGIGNCGSKVVKYAKALGMNVVQNDPPLKRLTGNPDFVPLDELMNCDIITLHVPLTYDGEDRTYHLFDRSRIFKMKRGSILINTSRGAVVETTALKDALSSGHLLTAVIDVWENEPNIDSELLEKVFIGTPHIAGYSLDGKVNAIKMVYQAACKYFNQKIIWDPSPELQKTKWLGRLKTEVVVDIKTSLNQIIKNSYDILEDHEKMEMLCKLPKSQQGLYFMTLRTNYPIRREFFNTNVRIRKEQSELKKILEALNFKVVMLD